MYAATDFQTGKLGEHDMNFAKNPVLVYGASGYTGMLIIEQLIALGIPFIAAGRNAKKIQSNMAERVAGLENGDYEIVQVEHTVEALTDLLTVPKWFAIPSVRS
jgi:short subunit dehydrogenase-like uncharacterized protein